MARKDQTFELKETMRPPRSIDMADYAYDAPFKLDEEEDEEAVESSEVEAPIFTDDFDPFGGDVGDDDNDDDLFAALDQALDEIEEEQRIEVVRAMAAPEFDELELTRTPNQQYRDALKNFLAQPQGERAPRYTELERRVAVQSAALGSLLQDGFRRARLSVEQRKAVGKITNPELRSALTY